MPSLPQAKESSAPTHENLRRATSSARVWSVDTDVKPLSFRQRHLCRDLSHVGGFGIGSHLTWDTFGALGYQFNNSISTVAGYRHLEMDYERKGIVFDAALSGPVIGMTIRF